MDDVDLCQEVIDNGLFQVMTPINLNYSMSFDSFQLIPPDYGYALMVAYIRHKEPTMKSKPGLEFIRALEAAWVGVDILKLADPR